MVLETKRGIVLVTSLILAVLMLLFIGAAAALGLGNLGANRLTQEAAQAEQAAQSGLEYCLNQLRINPSWRGDQNGLTVDLPDLVVREDEGNIFGLLRTADGNWSQFRCRFNFQDGAGGSDGLDDPSTSIDLPYVSFNNLVGAAPLAVVRGEGPSYAVTPTSPTAHVIPTWAVSLAVEGRGGIRNGNPALPEGAYQGTVRTLEAVYRVEAGGPPVVGSAGMAGGNFTANLGSGTGTVLVDSDTGTPRLRSKGTAAVSGGGLTNFVSPDGEVRNPGQTFEPGTSFDSTQVALVEEQPADPFVRLGWDEVRKADATHSLAGGTYVWWDDGTLHYYDMSFDDYATYMQDPANVNDVGLPLNLPATVQMVDSGGVKRLVVSGDVAVTSSLNGVDSLAVIPRMGAAEAPVGDPEAATAVGGLPPVDVIAAHFGSDQALWHQFLTTYQPGRSEIELKSDDPSNNNFVEIEWNSTGITNTDFQNGGSYEELMKLIWDPTLAPTDYIWDTDEDPVAFDQNAAASFFGITAGGGPQIDPPGVTDGLTASSIAIEFAPPVGESAVLSAEGDVRLTGSVTGTGGSVVSGGEIRVTGMGASFAGQENPVNMYARGDIYLSTLDEDDTVADSYAYSDLTLSGIVYTQGNFITRLGSDQVPASSWGSFQLNGLLIAYGGDPTGQPGSSGGDIDLRAGQVELTYNNSYAGALAAAPPAGFRLAQSAWSNRL